MEAEAQELGPIHLGLPGLLLLQAVIFSLYLNKAC